MGRDVLWRTRQEIRTERCFVLPVRPSRLHGLKFSSRTRVERTKRETTGFLACCLKPPAKTDAFCRTFHISDDDKGIWVGGANTRLGHHLGLRCQCDIIKASRLSGRTITACLVFPVLFWKSHLPFGFLHHFTSCLFSLLFCCLMIFTCVWLSVPPLIVLTCVASLSQWSSTPCSCCFISVVSAPHESLVLLHVGCSTLVSPAQFCVSWHSKFSFQACLISTREDTCCVVSCFIISLCYLLLLK